MARERDPNRDKAFELYKDHEGDITNREIGKILDVPEKKIAVWKQRDKWSVVQQNKINVVQQKKPDITKVKKGAMSASEVEVVEEELPALTAMQERFAEEYLIDLNATQAAIRAGYSPRTAQEQSSRLMKNLSIKAFIDKAIAERSRRTGITQERVLEELAKIAFADMRKFAKWSKEGIRLLESGQLTEEDAACVSELSETVTQFGGSIKFKLHDKKGALELLGRHLKLFTDKLEIKDTTDRAQSMKKARERVRNGQTK